MFMINNSGRIYDISYMDDYKVTYSYDGPSADNVIITVDGKLGYKEANDYKNLEDIKDLQYNAQRQGQLLMLKTAKFGVGFVPVAGAGTSLYDYANSLIDIGQYDDYYQEELKQFYVNRFGTRSGFMITGDFENYDLAEKFQAQDCWFITVESATSPDGYELLRRIGEGCILEDILASGDDYVGNLFMAIESYSFDSENQKEDVINIISGIKYEDYIKMEGRDLYTYQKACAIVNSCITDACLKIGKDYYTICDNERTEIVNETIGN